MNDIQLVEGMLKDYVGVKGPYTSGPKRALFDFCIQNAQQIRTYLALGIDAVAQSRRDMIVKWLAHDSPNVTQTEQAFNVWVADVLMGPVVPGDSFVVRCLGCQKLRTSRGMSNGACKCGSRRTTNVKEFSTSQGLYALATGY